MRAARFEKWQALGNDYVIVEADELPWELTPARVRRLCHRHLGIGRRLIDWLVESARVAGIASIHLELRADNVSAQAFYRALGFSETLVVPGYYDGRVSARRMLRMLRSPRPED